jgi:hypothetical protein
MKRLLLLLSFAVCALAQTADYPGAIATDATLLTACNRAQSMLSAGIDASTLSIPVASGATWASCVTGGAATLVTIDNENIKICSVTGNTLNVCTGGRGFDGTVAASHVSGRDVRSQVTGYFHRKVSKEIQAIQGALGVNLQTVNTGTYISTKFDFTAQQPGGSLAAGNNTITVAPVPEGVNWNNTSHYLYVSGGVGSAEACLIVAAGPGTATSGAASGTLTINCANTHSGAWTIRSATAGIQEAIYAAANFSAVRIPGGSHVTYATITKPASKKVSLHGDGSATSFIRAAFASGNTLYVDSAYVGNYTQSVTGIGFLPSAVRAAGSELQVDTAYYSHFEDLYAGSEAPGSAYIGFTFKNFNSTTIRSLRTSAVTRYGLQLLATAASGGIISDSMFSVNTAAGGIAGAVITGSATGGYPGLFLLNTAFQGGQYNVYVDPAGGYVNEFKLVGNDYDGATVYAVAFVSTGGGGSDIQISGGRLGPLASNAGLVYFSKDWTRVKVEGLAGSTAGDGTGFTFDGTDNVLLSNNSISGSGNAGVSDISLLISASGGSPVKGFRAIGNSFGFNYDGTSDDGTPPGSSSARFGVVVTAAAHEIELIGNRFYGTNDPANGTGAISYSGTGTAFLRDNVFKGGVKPTCAATLRGSTWQTEGGAGVTDALEVCRKSAADAYAWTALY